MARSDAAHLEKLRQVRDDLVTDLANRTSEWAAAGSPPDYSVNGRSFQWTAWLSARRQAIADLDATIRGLEVPTDVFVTGYTP